MTLQIFAHGVESSTVDTHHPSQTVLLVFVSIGVAFLLLIGIRLLLHLFAGHRKDRRLDLDRKNMIIVTLALTILIFFSISEFRAQNNSALPPTTTPIHSRIPDATVILTEAGEYKPAVITIHVGQTVRWVNKSGNLMWPASNGHPSHDLLPGFDPKRILKDGESWDYTFTKAGEWGYHDHLNPMRRATVIVLKS